MEAEARGGYGGRSPPAPDSLLAVAAVPQVHLEHGAYPSPLNYYRFPKSVCTSVNEVICHGIPDLRPLEDGDIVNIDVSTYLDG